VRNHDSATNPQWPSNAGLLATLTVKSARPAARTRARPRSAFSRSSHDWW